MKLCHQGTASSGGGGHSILALIAEARDTMKVKGRDTMMRETEGRCAGDDAAKRERAEIAKGQLDAIIKREQAALAVLCQKSKRNLVYGIWSQ